ncbi:DUF2306 domain-containing protein [Agromyces bauzanensis]
MTSGTSRPLRSADAARSRGPARAPRIGARSGWAWIALSSLAITAFAVVPYLTTSLAELSESGVGVAGTYDGRPAAVQAAFYAHVVAGGIALVAGPFQFWRGLRDRHRSVHRWVGRGYLAAVAIAGVAGLVIAPFGEAGLSGLFGFGTLAVLWLATGWAAYRSIRRGDVASHRAWMMRNFALTYAAVTLRLWLGVLIGAQVLPGGSFDAGAAFANAYAVVPFLAWLPNLVVVEWLIRRRGLPTFRLSPGTETASPLRG